MQSEVITICACTSRSFIDKEKLATIATHLKNNGYKVNLTDDLCRIAVDEPDKLKDMAKGTIMACHSRAIKAHLNGLGVHSNKMMDIRSNSSDEVLATYPHKKKAASTSSNYADVVKEIEALPAAEGKDAWYPVIDKSLCTNCGKCHDFCLFGVYTIPNKQVQVTQPHNCKNNCPACARICPSKAIIFPKYEKPPINGGTDIEEVVSEEDMEAMYQKRLQYRLQQNRHRFSLLKKDI